MWNKPQFCENDDKFDKTRKPYPVNFLLPGDDAPLLDDDVEGPLEMEVETGEEPEVKDNVRVVEVKSILLVEGDGDVDSFAVEGEWG